jgi:hypothetical protein
MSLSYVSRAHHAALAFALVAGVIVGATGCASHAPAADSAASVSGRSALPSPEGPADLLPGSNDGIAAIHRSKCGACHTPVEPGSLARGVAESAMHRHRRRAKLSEQQWSDMVDYLSNDRAAHARSSATLQ